MHENYLWIKLYVYLEFATSIISPGIEPSSSWSLRRQFSPEAPFASPIVQLTLIDSKHLEGSLSQANRYEICPFCVNR